MGTSWGLLGTSWEPLGDIKDRVRDLRPLALPQGARRPPSPGSPLDPCSPFPPALTFLPAPLSLVSAAHRASKVDGNPPASSASAAEGHLQEACPCAIPTSDEVRGRLAPPTTILLSMCLDHRLACAGSPLLTHRSRSPTSGPTPFPTPSTRIKVSVRCRCLRITHSRQRQLQSDAAES